MPGLRMFKISVRFNFQFFRSALVARVLSLCTALPDRHPRDECNAPSQACSSYERCSDSGRVLVVGLAQSSRLREPVPNTAIAQCRRRSDCDWIFSPVLRRRWRGRASTMASSPRALYPQQGLGQTSACSGIHRRSQHVSKRHSVGGGKTIRPVYRSRRAVRELCVRSLERLARPEPVPSVDHAGAERGFDGSRGRGSLPSYSRRILRHHWVRVLVPGGLASGVLSRGIRALPHDQHGERRTLKFSAGSFRVRSCRPVNQKTSKSYERQSLYFYVVPGTYRRVYMQYLEHTRSQIRNPAWTGFPVSYHPYSWYSVYIGLLYLLVLRSCTPGTLYV